jgi:DegV family protein with EDD domain
VLLDGRRVAAKIDRVVVLEDAFAQAEEPVADLLRTLLEFMGDDLPEMVHGKIAPDGFDPWREAFRIVQAYETWQTFGGFVTTHKPKIGAGVRERMQFASTVTGAQADAARDVIAKAREHIRQIAVPGTVLALPTAPSIAPKIETPGEDLEEFRIRVMRLTCTSGISGLPQMSIPGGTINGWVDSHTYTVAYGYAMIEAAKKVSAGESFEAVHSFLNEWFSRVEICFSVYTLEHIKKSGRLSVAAAFMGELLGLKPIIRIVDGVPEIVEKARGDKNVVPHIIKEAEKRMYDKNTPIEIFHAETKDRTAEMAAILKEQIKPSSINIYPSGAAISINGGPTLVGIVYLGQKRR